MITKKLTTVRQLQANVKRVFGEVFGTTPLRQRLEDILKEAVELSRYTDVPSLKEEAGDLLNSVLQLLSECDWKAEEVSKENLDKIKRRKDQYRSLGRKLSVAILGGAFDPPTRGHIETAQLVLDTSNAFDEIWMMPCYKHVHNKKMAPAKDRLAMCELAAAVDPRIKVFDYEIRTRLRGETYHMVKMLMCAPETHRVNFSIIVGMDNANSFDKWVNYEDLERLIRFVVVPRRGVKRDPRVNWYLKPPHVFLMTERPPMEISSTDVRLAFHRWYSKIVLSKGENWLFARSLVGSNRGMETGVEHTVCDYILKRGLYQKST